jgi:hypothetical protein
MQVRAAFRKSLLGERLVLDVVCVCVVVDEAVDDVGCVAVGASR